MKEYKNNKNTMDYFIDGYLVKFYGGILLIIKKLSGIPHIVPRFMRIVAQNMSTALELAFPPNYPNCSPY